MLLTAVWLQHSYFRGATWLRKGLESNLNAVMIRHDEMQKQKEKEKLIYPCFDGKKFNDDGSLLTIKDDSVEIISPSKMPLKCTSLDATFAPDKASKLSDIVNGMIATNRKEKKSIIENDEKDDSSIDKKNI